MELCLPCLYAFVGCMAFAVAFNIHGWDIPLAALGGTVGWFVYLASEPLFPGEISRCLAAALALALYCEVMARVRRRPVPAYLLISIFPLVPGAGIYHTMEHAIRGEMDLFLTSGLHTMGLAGALALGILLVSSAARMWTMFRRRKAGNTHAAL